MIKRSSSFSFTYEALANRGMFGVCLAEYFDYWIFALEREREEKKIKEETLRQAGNREVRTGSVV